MVANSAVQKTEQKPTFRKFKDGDYKWDKLNDQIFQADHSYKCPTYVYRTPPCQGSCPFGEDIHGWLSIVRGIEKPPSEDVSMQEYAFQRSTAANPFPSMMGCVCPAPCQVGCNRNQVEDYVGINAVEQYIGDYAYKESFKFQDFPPISNKKVAIVGGGSAGLSAAYHLRRKGHASAIFEEHEELGGMMRYGISGYRTPRDILGHEIQRILDMGSIKVHNSVRVGKDLQVSELEKEYDAIIWCVGCQSGRALPVAGYVAHDAAFSAAREGAEVTLTSLFPSDEMTASEHEVQDALKEWDLQAVEFGGGNESGTCESNFSIHNYEDRSSQEVIPPEKLFLGHFSYVTRNQRDGCGPGADKVLGHFEERVVGLDDKSAVGEAERCMSCGMCFECDNCVIFYPQDAVFRVDKSKNTTGHYVDTDYDCCIGCHICADVCPTGYIDMALGEIIEHDLH